MTTPTRQPDLTDLTEAHWDILRPLMRPAQPGGRPRAVDRRAIINTILSLNRTGCQGDMLPHARLPKSPVYDDCAPWRDDGTWQPMLAALRAEVRRPQAPAREPTPSAARLDRQSVQTTAQGGARGEDGGKHIKGRQRPMRVAVLGLLWVVLVSRAARDAALAAPPVLQPWALATSPRLAVVGAESQSHHHGLNAWIATAAPGHWRLEVVRRPEGSKGFVLLPKRWVVERTLAWLSRCRRTSKDDARRTDSSASMIRIRAMHLMLKRLQPANVYRPFRYRHAA